MRGDRVHVSFLIFPISFFTSGWSDLNKSGWTLVKAARAARLSIPPENLSVDSSKEQTKTEEGLWDCMVGKNLLA